jgi:transcriptional regulator with XRE-family HTH domain
MNIGERVRSIRQSRKMSQGDVERRTGLLRCYISRVENGHTVPSVETLEKIARAFDLKIYHILYESDQPPAVTVSRRIVRSPNGWGSRGTFARYMSRLTRLLPELKDDERSLLLYALGRMTAAKRARSTDQAANAEEGCESAESANLVVP